VIPRWPYNLLTIFKDGRDNLLEEFLISQSGQSSRTGLSRRQSPRCSPNFDTKYYLEGGVHMKFVREALRCSLFLCLAVLLLPVVALAQHYKQTNLVSDLASISTPNPPDPNLKNPWGRSEEHTSELQSRSD